MTDAWIESLLGMTLGGYRLERFIEKGGFGYVFEVTRLETSAPFAMKVLLPGSNTEAHLDFDNEGFLLRRLNVCSRVINLVDSGCENVPITLGGSGAVPLPIRYHVLSLASGSLGELIQSPALLNELSWCERILLWRGAVKGVHQMHLKSIAHRDLKSSNCLLMVVGTTTQLRLADLGRSKDFTQTPVHNSSAYLGGLGDARFAPPECLLLQGGSSESDFRNADLYGIGSLLVELATGHPMTALAMTSWVNIRNLGIKDFHAGITRDLATLRPQFHAAIAGIEEDLPAPIRQDVSRLLSQLCDPVPSARQPRGAMGRRHVPDNGLLWLLRRADIFSRQLAVAPRRRRYRTMERSA